MAIAQNRSGVGDSFAQDEAALKRGKGGVVAIVIVILVGGVAGLWALMRGGDEARVYGELGKKLNGMKQAHFDQFWGCALPGADLSDIKTNTDLVTQLEARASQGGQRYAVHLRDTCAAKLTDIEPMLDSLITPADINPSVSALSSATSDLRSAVSGLISYLDNPELNYESAAASTHFDKIVRGWFEFRKAHADLNKTLKTHLDAH